MNLTAADLENITAIVAASQAAANATQAAATLRVEALINDAVGGLSTRVETVESSVSALESAVANINERINQIKGESSFSTQFDDVLPSLIAAERVAFEKVLVIKGAAATTQLELDQFLGEFFSVLNVENAAVEAASFMGKQRVDQGRLIRLQLKDASQAQQILKGKSKLRAIPNWSNVFVNQMRSRMVGRLESRMNGFFRVNQEKIKMKKYNDCLLFVETGIRIPVYKFGAETITVGNHSFNVSGTTPAANLVNNLVNEPPTEGTEEIIPDPADSQPRRSARPKVVSKRTNLKNTSGKPRKKREKPYVRGLIPAHDHGENRDDSCEEMDDSRIRVGDSSNSTSWEPGASSAVSI
jgi:hypothetical protein